jgi:hypothetical protein
MKDRGFVVYDICGFVQRPLDGALAQVDLAFVKENGHFRKCHDYAAPKVSVLNVSSFLLKAIVLVGAYVSRALEAAAVAPRYKRTVFVYSATFFQM